MGSFYEIYKQNKVGKLWPIKQKRFEEIVSGSTDRNNKVRVFTQEIEGEIVGYICAKSKQTPTLKKGVIVLLVVDEEYQSRGIGSELLLKAIKWLKEQHSDVILFGGGAGTYFWPGLPKNLDVESFFTKNGFKVTDKGCVDMYGEMANYETPKGTFEKIEDQGIQISFSTPEWSQKILDFNNRYFKDWYEYYEKHFKKKEYDNVFFAHKDGKVIATSELWENNCNWELLFDESVGGGGALGVAEDWRGKGLGKAMKAWGTEKIKERGIKYVWISWTYSVDFYKTLGFDVWREFWNVKMEEDK